MLEDKELNLAKFAKICYIFPRWPGKGLLETNVMNPFQKLVDYLRSSQTELKKVSWPTRRDTIRYSILVIGISVVVAVFFTALDTGLHASVIAALARKQPVQTQTQQQTNTQMPVTPETPPINVNAVTASGTPINIEVNPLK